MTSKKSKILIGIVLLLIGIGVLGIGFFKLNNYLDKRKTYLDIKGVVIDYEVKYDDGELYAPVIEYFVDERRYEVIYNGYSDPPKYYLGEIVSLKYNPSNPEDVIFKYDTSFWVLALVGGVFTLVGFIAIFAKNKHK